MSRIKKPNPSDDAAIWHTALYTRLSREDGDKPDSDSIINQTKLLENYIISHPDLTLTERYADDGFTGTNFNRPEFHRMIQDIERGKINCVLVKDLSRFGRDYIDVGRYLERWFPDHHVRFIAVGDSIDSETGPYDMLLPVKNIFNEQYARDISKKVCSAMHTKQSRGDFIGAFAPYGYQKDPQNHNKLIPDPPAAAVIQRVFDLYQQGTGQQKIAVLLNRDGIPCPSEYKKLRGQKYHNGQKLGHTTYWTYSTIHRILSNQMYIGNMVQGRTPRQGMHGKAKKVDKSQWLVVPNTHEAIIPQDQWDKVQILLKKNTWTLSFDGSISPFAGYLRCGDCGRAMCKTTDHVGGIYYSCGSYKRYGAAICTKHSISYKELEQVVLDDLNRIISAVQDLTALAEEARPREAERDLTAERDKLTLALERIYRLKKSSYEDHQDGLLEKADYLRYKADYERQEAQLNSQLELLTPAEHSTKERPWIKSLLKHGKITQLDRATVAETIREIRVFEDHRIEITYSFEDDLGILTEQKQD